MANFSFETSSSNNSFIVRAWSVSKFYLIFCSIFFGVVLIGIVIQLRELSWIIIVMSFGITMSVCLIICSIEIYLIRNYIVKLINSDGIVKIERYHYNKLTTFSCRLYDLEIKKKASFWGRSGALYSLQIKFLTDDKILIQYARLDWNQYVMGNIIDTLYDNNESKI